MSQERREELERDVERGPLNFLVVGVALLVAAFQLYEGLGPPAAGSTPAAPSTFLGIALLAGVVVFFTDYWRPALYLVGLYVLVIWLLGRTSLDPVSLGTAGSAALLSLLCLAVLYAEHVAYLSDEPRQTR